MRYMYVRVEEEQLSIAATLDLCKHLRYTGKRNACALLDGPTSQYTSYEPGKGLKYLIMGWLRS